MKLSFPPRLLVFLGLFVFSSALLAQLPSLPLVKPKTEAAAPAAGVQLQQWLKEARGAFARANETDAETHLPEGIDASALADYRRNLDQIITGIGRHQKILDASPDANKALEAARTAESEWKGFTEKPPYSVLMIDELSNQRDTATEKQASYQSSIELFGRSLASIQSEAKLGEAESRSILADATQNPAEDGAPAWRLAADQAKTRLLAVRAIYLQSNIALLQDQAATAAIQLKLLDRQLKIAGKRPSLSAEDLEKISKAVTDRQAALRKEILVIRKREQDATTNRIRQLAAVDQMVKAAGEKGSDAPTPELELARVKAEASETKVDMLQFESETIDSLSQLESRVPEAYQLRKTLMEAGSKSKRETALTSLRTDYDRLTAWELVISNELASVNADINQQESRATSYSADDPKLALLNDIRASLWERQSVIQRVAQAVTGQRKMIKRWVDAFDNSQIEKSFLEKISDAATNAWSKIKAFWNIEVFEYYDPTMMGNVLTPNKGVVTLGTIITALAFFLVSYFIANQIKNRLRNVVVRRGTIAEAQANTLSNWLMIVVGFLLVIATLHFVKIPLTVFAFFGGALAIGLGFGMQTLIKNFISGIIVLFERKVRVGDVVEIDANTSGKIIEINTRSSVLRSSDGKETLIPNSLFLENRITNLTLSNRRVRRVLRVAVGYGCSPSQVITVLKECTDRHGLILKDPAPVGTLDDFGAGSLVFAIFFWIELNDKTDGNVVASDIRIMIEKRFAEVGIDFPNLEQNVSLKSETPLQVHLVKPEKPAPAPAPEPAKKPIR
jgi:potassium efflux system protein